MSFRMSQRLADGGHSLRSSCQSCTSWCNAISSQPVMFKKVKQITVMLVNVNQVSVTIIAIINQRRRQVQGRNHSRQTRLSRLQYLCTFILFSALFATCIFIVFRFMSFNQSLSQSSCLTAVSNSSRVISLSSVASVVNFSCHIHLQNGSSTSAFSSGQCSQ